MGAGCWTVACLLLLGQVPDDVPVSNQRGFRFDLNNIDPARRQEFVEFRLFTSRNQGKTWEQAAQIKTEQNGFEFHATEDGLYWFRVAGVNRQGKQEPENLFQGPPDQKLLIDATKPLVRITNANRQGDEVVVAWDITEENPDWTSLKLEYRGMDNPDKWSAVPLNPQAKGETRFRPAGSATLEVRIELKDKAGNRGFGNVEVPGTTAVAINSAPPAPISPPPAPSYPPPAQGAAPIAPPPSEPRVSPPPVVDNTPPRQFPAERLGSPPPVGPAPFPTPRNDNTRLVASSETIPGVPGSGVRKPLPPIQYVNNPDVTLEYELTKIGPSGIGSIEIYWTHNDGQTWEKYAVDDEVKPNMPSGRYQRTFPLNQGDKVYGFTLVVKNRVGRGRPEPRSGDVPELRIGLDTLPPTAQLFAGPDPQRPGHLLLQWSANDANLTQTPINLEWCDRANGNWRPIAINQPNTNRYSWQVPEGIPYQVFLRLRVRDAAGNEGIAVTPEAQIVDLSEPEGRLLNVSVPNRRP